MSLIWVKSGNLYERVYTSKGYRSVYRIALDKNVDRWTIYADNTKRVENIYYVTDAKKIAEVFEMKGKFILPSDLRARPDGQISTIVPSAQAKPHLVFTEQPAHPVAIQAMPSISEARKSLLLPQPEVIALKLHFLVTSLGITPEKAGSPWLPWQSGVYALVDCVYSSQATYNSVVLPALRRLSAQPNLHDQPNLGFTAFVEDVNKFGNDKFERYASEVLTRNKISNRLKTEICYEAACFFSSRGLETMADLKQIGAELEPLILNELRPCIRGIGPALAHYLLTLFGDEDHVKLDTMINRFWRRMKDWSPRESNEQDYQIVLSAFRDVSSRLGSTPARLDNAIWRYESDQAKSLR